jgi:hypothetical protein
LRAQHVPIVSRPAALAGKIRGRAHDLIGLGPPWTWRLVKAATLADARRLVAELRAENAVSSPEVQPT